MVNTFHLESLAFQKKNPRLALVLKAAEQTWSSIPVLLPLDYIDKTLSVAIANHLFISGVASLRWASKSGPIENIEEGIVFVFKN